jgi:hypothetical protein
VRALDALKAIDSVKAVDSAGGLGAAWGHCMGALDALIAVDSVIVVDSAGGLRAVIAVRAVGLRLGAAQAIEGEQSIPLNDTQIGVPQVKVEEHLEREAERGRERERERKTGEGGGQRVRGRGRVWESYVQITKLAQANRDIFCDHFSFYLSLQEHKRIFIPFSFFQTHPLLTYPVLVRLFPSVVHEAVPKDDNFVLLPLIGGHQQLHSANS